MRAIFSITHRLTEDEFKEENQCRKVLLKHKIWQIKYKFQYKEAGIHQLPTTNKVFSTYLIKTTTLINYLIRYFTAESDN